METIHKQLILIIIDVYLELSLECLLKWFGFYKSNKTVSSHEQVDGVLCFQESVFVRTLQVLFDFLSGLVVKVNLCRWNGKGEL